MSAFEAPSERAQAAAGSAMHDLMARLFPICRSITGDGLRETLSILAESIPLQICEVPSGTRCFDWTVPREWTARDAYIIDPQGRKLAQFSASNLHLWGYSTPVDARLTLAELRPHLYSLPELPDAVPYRTTYYEENWGFCLAHREYMELEDGEYQVHIDTALVDGSLTYGELYIEGQRREEVLLSTYICHPSMCNDNLSGVVVAAALAEVLGACKPEFSYRFLFAPETIGSLVWLSRNESELHHIWSGLALNSLGDPAPLTYKKSRRGDAPIDRAASHVLRHRGPHRLQDFAPTGSDERQFCSPGFDLPVGALMRAGYDFQAYHTSLDDLDLVSADQLADSLAAARTILGVLEQDRYCRNLKPKGEPQLGRRGLYGQTGASRTGGVDHLALQWTLNLADGSHSLLDTAERAGMPFAEICAAASALRGAGLLEDLDTPRMHGDSQGAN